MSLSNSCNLDYVLRPPRAAPADFDKCRPTGGGLEVANGKETVPAQLRGSVVNCDCANTQSPNIGNAAVHQCLGQERTLLSLAGQGDLVFDVENGKLTFGEFCDHETAGPAAWPTAGAPAEAPNSGPDPPPCTEPPDINSRCLPTG